MPNALGKGAPSFGAGFKGLADMLASALRGGVVGTLGGPGDIESLISSGNSHLLPRSEDMNRLLPEATQDPTWKGFEEVGQFLPTSGAKVASKAAPAALAGFVPPAKIGPVQDTLGTVKLAKKVAPPLFNADESLTPLKTKLKLFENQQAHLTGLLKTYTEGTTEHDVLLSKLGDVQKNIDTVKASLPASAPAPAPTPGFVALKTQEAALQKQIFDIASNTDPHAMGWDDISHLSDQLIDIQKQIKAVQSTPDPKKLPLQLKSVEETGGSLWPGSKRNDLALIHASHFDAPGSKYGSENVIPSELTHPSLMIPAPKSTSAQGFGSNFLIADPRKFEPRTSGSVIKGSDFYSPRYQSAHFKGVKDPAEYGNVPRSSLLRLGAKERLADKNKFKWAKSGAFQEVGSATDSPWALTTKYSPEFSSFRHFEENPKGAARLDKYEPGVPPHEVTERYTQALREFGDRGLTIEQAGVSRVPSDEQFTKNRYKFNQLHDPEFWIKHGKFKDEPISPEIADDITIALRQYRKEFLEHAPSEYAEVKRYGHVPITGDSFTHALVQPELYAKQGEWLRNRGVTPINFDDVLQGKSILGSQNYSRGYIPDEDLTKMIARLQAETLRRR